MNDLTTTKNICILLALKYGPHIEQIHEKKEKNGGQKFLHCPFTPFYTVFLKHLFYT
jgi:hypothetical protein